jgi:trans-L-3-hydroxyproline dehydratase
MAVGQQCEIKGVSGEGFVGTLAASRASPSGPVSRVRVSGRSYYSGRAEFVAEPGDRFAHGFALPRRVIDTLTD